MDETHPYLQEFQTLHEALNQESERGTALIAAAMIDDLLERSILAFLLDHEESKRLLQGFNAPLGSLSAKALAAFALGLLSGSEYRECGRVCKVRNLFAHNLHASFQDPEVEEICANLDFSANGYGRDDMDAREQYITATVTMITNLTNRPHYAAKRRVRYIGLPY